ncbi:MAG: acyloxyacyl hydrolase [Halieaceae bacterium]|nr:acyloxyacyl hydrolase [Halieaceae bacterium]
MRIFVKRTAAVLSAAIVALAGGLVSGEAHADDPAFLTLTAGAYDFNKQDDTAAEFRVEYRSDYKMWELKPFAALAGTTNNSYFVGAGVLMDIYFGRRFVVTPSFAPHYYAKGSSDGKDLGHALEFRSQVEFSYRFDDRSRLGLGVSHYSNASIGDKNPGSETLSLVYSIPITNIFD